MVERVKHTTFPPEIRDVNVGRDRFGSDIWWEHVFPSLLASFEPPVL